MVFMELPHFGMQGACRYYVPLSLIDIITALCVVACICSLGVCAMLWRILSQALGDFVQRNFVMYICDVC